MSIPQTLDLLPRLCTCTRSRLKPQLKLGIERPRYLKNQHVAKNQDQARETRYRQEEGLPCWAGEPGKGQGHHQKQAVETPRQALPGLAGGGGQSRPPNHSSATHVANQCGVKPQDDYVASICHMSTPFYRKHPQVTPVLRRVKRASAELAR